jgi:aspartate kinase
MMSRIVMKFGGTSVGSSQALGQVAQIIKEYTLKMKDIVVVVSAMGDITDQLLLAGQQSIGVQPGSWGATFESIQEQIRSTAINSLLVPDEFLNILQDRILDLKLALQTIEDEHVLTPLNTDRLLSFGERINVFLVCAVLREAGINSIALESSTMVLTDDRFQQAIPLQPETDERISRAVEPVLEAGGIPVITGFIGATVEGEITTLGRGGSDYSAAIFGAALDADEVWIWTDVDGVLTSDPALVSEARLIEEMTYGDVFKLASFGARVLHPKTIMPLHERDIPIRVKNTFNPSCAGTRVIPERVAKMGARAVTGMELSILAIRGRADENSSLLVRHLQKILTDLGFQVVGSFQKQGHGSVYLGVTPQLKQGNLDWLEMQLENSSINGRKIVCKSFNANSVVAVIGDRINPGADEALKLGGSLRSAGVDYYSDSLMDSANSCLFLVPDHQCTLAIKKLHQQIMI